MGEWLNYSLPPTDMFTKSSRANIVRILQSRELKVQISISCSRGFTIVLYHCGETGLTRKQVEVQFLGKLAEFRHFCLLRIKKYYYAKRMSEQLTTAILRW